MPRIAIIARDGVPIGGDVTVMFVEGAGEAMMALGIGHKVEELCFGRDAWRPQARRDPGLAMGPGGKPGYL